jgi:hypothetical protein
MPRMYPLLAVALALAACAAREPTTPEVALTEPVEPPRAPDLGRSPPRITADLYDVYVADLVRSTCTGSYPLF